MSKIQTVIMAGGLGTRLWPLSRQSCPKQFINVFNDQSLLQDTLVRNKSFGKQLVIVGENHRFIAAQQVLEVNANAELIIEPCPKSTAPCAIIASLFAIQNGCDVVLLLPSDLYISDTDKYISLINYSLHYAQSNIVTIGVRPTYPNTGYGYIKISDVIDTNIYKAKQFVEKPDISLATSYLKQADYFWNSGIFIFNPEYLLKQASKLSPSIVSYVRQSVEQASKDCDFIRLNKEFYQYIDAISVDYAIMEKVEDIVLLEATFYWNDLGNWQALWEMSNKDDNGNYVEGNAVISGVKNSYINSVSKLTTVIGLDNIVVVNTKDAVLVANKDELEQVKQLVNKLIQNV